nr:RNA-directed DNA polymerase, eukaryota, reverse transcriptase zinc-binding domain protein [Tanacetum cinerariifolium]
MFFKVDFSKAYHTVRWDFLIDVLQAFGFGIQLQSSLDLSHLFYTDDALFMGEWSDCNMRGIINILKCFHLASGLQMNIHKSQVLGMGIPCSFVESMASSLGCSVMEDKFCYLGVMVGDKMSCHKAWDGVMLKLQSRLSNWKAKTLSIRGRLTLLKSILNEIFDWCKRKNKKAMFFKVDFSKAYDTVRWEFLIDVLQAFGFGLQMNIHKSQVLGMGIPCSFMESMASSLGCSVMEDKFCYLGVMVGDKMSCHKAWDGVMLKLQSRLSNWKAKTLSIRGRLTLLKSVLGASPLYNMSIFKVPKGVLKSMESIHSKFFKGASPTENKISWIAWDKVLASKKKGGLGISSFFALNRALLLKWVWRFVSQDSSLWYQVIQAVHGDKIGSHSVRKGSIWSSILKEVQVLKSFGFDFMSYCSKRIGDEQSTNKLAGSLDASFRRPIRGGAEHEQLSDLASLLNPMGLSLSNDRWFYSLSSSGAFNVKDTRLAIDDLILPSYFEPTRWVNLIPIKINVFMWRACRDGLPTRHNLARKGVNLESTDCPVCQLEEEDVCHLLFRCSLAQEVLQCVCRWWEIDFQNWLSFSDWDVWFFSIRLP